MCCFSRYIKESVGTNKVLLLVSGGVDSTVCAALLHKALRPDQIIAIHIDNGFMRKNETTKVHLMCLSKNIVGRLRKELFYVIRKF